MIESDNTRRRTVCRLALALCLAASASAACDAREGPARTGAAPADDGVQYAVASEQVAAAPPPPALAPMQEGRGGGGVVGAAQAPSAPSPGTQVATGGERKIIRNGSVRFEVENTDRAVEALKALVASFGGYLASEQRDEDARTGRQAFVTCRIPSQKLDEMLGRLEEIGKQEAVNLASEDVSEQYLDLEVRLRTQQQLEERLRSLLDRPSNRLSDLLEIEKEVARVRGEIDSMQGRKRYWDNQVAFSTLTVQVHEPRPVVASDKGGVWATLKGAFGDSADNFVRTIAGLIAALGAFVPLALAFVAAFWAIRLLWRRGRRRSGGA